MGHLAGAAGDVQPLGPMKTVERCHVMGFKFPYLEVVGWGGHSSDEKEAVEVRVLARNQRGSTKERSTPGRVQQHDRTGNPGK